MDEIEIVFLLKQINNLLKMHADADLNELGLTFSQLSLLKCVDEAGGSITQKEIELQLKVSHPTVVGLISRLEKNGYVITQPCVSGCRSKQVIMTAKGKEQRKRLEAHHIQMDRMLLNGLGPDEIRTLGSLLERLYENIRPEESLKGGNAIA